MTREDLQALIADDFETLKERIEKYRKVIKVGKKEYTIADLLKQYDPALHDVNDPSKRKDKLKESDSSTEYNDSLSGEFKTEKHLELVTVNRNALPIQQKIVLIAAAFLVGEKILLDSDTTIEIEKTLLSLITKVWEDNKLDYKSKEIAKILKSETLCAELWFDEPDRDYWDGTINEGSVRRPGMMILSESNGDKLYVVKDQYKKLIAVGRGYTIMEGDEEVEHFDLYTDEVIIEGVNTSNGWTANEKPNPYGAVQLIVHEQPRPDWMPVQPLIERKEEFFSNFSDNNDYYAFQAMVAEGEVTSLPDKNEVGKIFQVEQGGDIRFIGKEGAIESMKLEFDTLNKEIHSGTHTPDISFETMKTLLGGSITGVALKLLFMDPQMKASDGQEQFGEMIQRRLNLLKRMIISFNPVQLKPAKGLRVSPRFRQFMPVNEVEYNELLITAYQSGMISHKTMLELSTLVKNADTELKEILAQPAPVNPNKPVPDNS